MGSYYHGARFGTTFLELNYGTTLEVSTRSRPQLQFGNASEAFHYN